MNKALTSMTTLYQHTHLHKMANTYTSNSSLWILVVNCCPEDRIVAQPSNHLQNHLTSKHTPFQQNHLEIESLLAEQLQELVAPSSHTEVSPVHTRCSQFVHRYILTYPVSKAPGQSSNMSLRHHQT